MLIVDAPPRKTPVDAVHDATLPLLLAELPLASAVRIAALLTGVPRNRLYERALALKGKTEA